MRVRVGVRVRVRVRVGVGVRVRVRVRRQLVEARLAEELLPQLRVIRRQVDHAVAQEVEDVAEVRA